MTALKNQFHLSALFYRPGSTVKHLVEADRGHRTALVISAFFGLMQALRFNAGSSDAFPFSRLPILSAGILTGISGLYFFAVLVRNFSRWFGGQAELSSVRTALGLSLLPWTLLSGALLSLLVSGFDASTAVILMPVFLVLFLYGYVIVLLSVGAVLGLNALRTTLTLAISSVVAFFIIQLGIAIFLQLSEFLVQ